MKKTLLASNVLVGLVLLACSKSSSSVAKLPLVTPPVKAAAPSGLKATRALDAGDIKSRFFTAGPSDIFGILEAIDERITDINAQSAGSSSPCLTQVPVSYTISPFGQSITMYGQCYETVTTSADLASDPKLVQWGVKDGITYIYTAIGAGEVAAIATPIASVAGAYHIQAWLSVGFYNSPHWDSGSYGVIQIDADSSSHSFEMTAAGLGFGYCGAQLKSDTDHVYLTGSSDMGATCNAVDTLCANAGDLSTAAAAACSAALRTFTLPTIGRTTTAGSTQTFGASQYPTVPNVTLNGTASDALTFGPTAPTPGIGKF